MPEKDDGWNSFVDEPQTTAIEKETIIVPNVRRSTGLGWDFGINE